MSPRVVCSVLCVNFYLSSFRVTEKKMPTSPRKVNSGTFCVGHSLKLTQTHSFIYFIYVIAYTIYTHTHSHTHTHAHTSIQTNNFTYSLIHPLIYSHAEAINPFAVTKLLPVVSGPLEETVDDFWRMVWEQGTFTIVMLTKLEERGRVRMMTCHCSTRSLLSSKVWCHHFANISIRTSSCNIYSCCKNVYKIPDHYH